MREIKFRVWDKKNKKYYRECDWLSFKPNGIRFMWTDYDSGDTMVTELPRGDYELMQFTGLKDKNGKEIYEGDLLGYSDEKNKTDKVLFEVFYHDGIGKFDNCRTHYQGNRVGGYIPPLNSDNLEVIGNIWEVEG